MNNSKDELNRYIKNAETVRSLGEELGFNLHSFNPDWAIYYTHGRKVHDVPDEIMELLAKSKNLTWENEYNSYLPALILHRAMKQANLEYQAYNTAWMCSEYSKCTETFGDE